ncbi:toll/interleukin-1 receptor domain-containing protein [Legionella cincinnatiensis]|uniref:Uncharacterized protein containing a TIR (Toll-Interleukin 1-resistance) domain n=1 Tax=Legionella cincinnatiensis TaxID=28085 RepID=A0A378IKJ4_9GAMM|nr:toll/interleukin-1 receptor domain-containing protein [Legionella cincinnatiensis]KTC78704.1 hypothetical protein Lcin_3319 [Legionella cincinnatiensis]STX35292.1 Uncharacterized protein containing a TIR (Toll-Interleukin 1-resistance) domain [Legionella cincinnatiensis]
MIFLSHTYKDKPIVEKLAIPLAQTFGKENVFYDSWSIQPGDGIIDKMNSGLEKCKFFFFFVSQNSLQSNMVTMEWQNALYKKAQGHLDVIPIKIDNCMMPTIMSQILYIDLFGQGIDVATKQIIDVVSGENTFQPLSGFQNVRAYITSRSETKIIIEFRAEVYMEPQSMYGILLGNDKDDILYKAHEAMFNNGFVENMILSNGIKGNLVMLSRANPTSPDFPFSVEIESKTTLKIIGAMKAISRDKYTMIPLIDKSC